VAKSLRQVWRQLRGAGKKLILRDFIDDSWPRQQLSGVLATLPHDVRASIKATELDYHPGFANHPHIVTLPDHKKWIEYDLFGIGYGWTALPCWLADEISGRLSWAIGATDNSVEAITCRVSWQWLPDPGVHIGFLDDFHLQPAFTAVKHHIQPFPGQIRIQRIAELALVLVFHQHREGIFNSDAIAENALIAPVVIFMLRIQIERLKLRIVRHVQGKRIFFGRRIAVGAWIELRIPRFSAFSLP
jgi:hypothetical protein